MNQTSLVVTVLATIVALGVTALVQQQAFLQSIDDDVIAAVINKRTTTLEVTSTATCDIDDYPQNETDDSNSCRQTSRATAP
jgi:ABC-type lipoprotein release transport system permease subunit